MNNINYGTIKKHLSSNIFIIIGILLVNLCILLGDTSSKELNYADIIIFYILNVWIVYSDYNVIIKAGYIPNISKRWVLLFGVFFFVFWVWKRYTWLGDKTRILFWVLLLSTGVSFYYSYNAANNKLLGETACEQLSTHIMSEQYNRPDIKCSRVVGIKEIDKNFYKARAIFNNGTTQSITIDVREENGQQMVYVSLIPLGN
ncbi:hypothetical protein ACGANB_03875 [Salmonella enterica subsp. enterica serovar Aberdeen]|uniref:hypothetical protein n=1 Tax=Salmonella enterica TaxID=28901 RepID=UPI00370BC116